MKKFILTVGLLAITTISFNKQIRLGYYNRQLTDLMMTSQYMESLNKDNTPGNDPTQDDWHNLQQQVKQVRYKISTL